MSGAENRPVLVGVGQVQQRADDLAEAREPLSLMIEAAQLAGEDANAPALVGRADSIRVPKGLWGYSNAAALLAERLGATGAQTVSGPISGSTVQIMLSHAAGEIAAGVREVVLLVGGETQHSARRAKVAGVELRVTEQTDSEPDLMFSREGSFDRRAFAMGLGPPTLYYSICENALRHGRGETLDAHRTRIAQLWSGFSAVAADNPHAWIRRAKTAAEIATVSAENRMIAWPYTKLLTANMVVDQAAAVIVCSERAARRARVPSDRWVYLHAATDGAYTHSALGHPSYARQPAMGVAGRRALELAGVGVEAIDHFDVYSCFPAAVQLAADELGLDTTRPLTVTGGLTFAGGPFNSYVLHAIATMVERLRSHPGERGLVTSLGGLFGKHAFGIYSTAPPEGGYRHADVSGELDALPTVDVVDSYSGEATIESYTLRYENAEPAEAILALRTREERRHWARSSDPDLLAAATTEEIGGRVVSVDAEGVVAL